MNQQITGPVRKLNGTITPPGDKSISHRTLLAAAMSDGPCRVRGFLKAGVTERMMDCLKQLGVDMEFVDTDDLLILGREWQAPEEALQCGGSATTMRLLLGALAGRHVSATLDGSPQLRRRPMQRVIKPLQRMGANISSTTPGERAPLSIKAGQLSGIYYHPEVASAQVKSAILWAALGAEGETIIEESGPSRDHTERLFLDLGIPLKTQQGRIHLEPENRPFPAFSTTIPGDFSAAAFLMVAGICVPASAIHIKNVGVNPTRTGLLEALQAMGADIQILEQGSHNGEPIAELQLQSSDLQATNIAGTQVVRMIDEFPVFAVAASQAAGVTTVQDAADLRVKESDRISTLVGELRKLGVHIDERADGFVIEGGHPLRGAHVQAHGDHRLAMSLIVAGLLAEGDTTISGAECMHESYPGFLQDLAALGVELP